MTARVDMPQHAALSGSDHQEHKSLDVIMLKMRVEFTAKYCKVKKIAVMSA